MMLIFITTLVLGAISVVLFVIAWRVRHMDTYNERVDGDASGLIQRLEESSTGLEQSKQDFQRELDLLVKGRRQ